MKNVSYLIIFFCFISQVKAQELNNAKEIKIDTAAFADGRLPITNKPLNDAPDKLQFAIVSDLNGGNIPGVFSNAKNKLNQLQPSMVLSVGDLIDGYTTDSVVVKKEWNQFNSMVDSLDMPFFYVSGNHDVSNQFLKKQWLKRFGRTYYDFVYKNALFLILDTEDGNTDGIGATQIDYIKKAISAHKDVRWTFIFMHRPLWAYGNEQGYEQIGAALKGRNYTLFSGHHHNYMAGERDGQKHYVLATTGGGTYGRGAKFGEFQHITWVTLTDKAPTVVNIALDGIINDDVVSEDIYPEIQSLRMGGWLNPSPFVAASQFVDKANVVLSFKNPTKSVLKITGKIPDSTNWITSPNTINVSVPANGEIKQTVVFSARKAGEKLDVGLLDHLGFSLTATYHLRNQDYSLEASNYLKVDWHRTVPFDKNLSQDFAKQKFDTTNFIAVTYPQQILEDWDWHGVEDGLLKFKLGNDGKFLYVDAIIHDDKFLLLDTDKDQDKLNFYISGLSGKIPEVNIEIKPQLKGRAELTSNLKGILLESKWLGKNDWLLKLKIPVSNVQKSKQIRFNMSYRDVDDLTNSKPSVIFWRPKWGSEQDYKDSGMFSIGK